MQYEVHHFFISLVLAFSIYLFTNVASAEMGVQFPIPPTKGGAMLSQANPSVSPNDVKNRIRSLGKQNREELSKQIKEELSQQPKSSASTPAEKSEAPIPVQVKPAPVPGTPTFTEPQTAVLPAPTFAPSAPGASPPVGGDNQTTPPPNKEGIYTGFGAGTGTPPPPPSSGNPGGGWNIKY